MVQEQFDAINRNFTPFLPELENSAMLSPDLKRKLTEELKFSQEFSRSYLAELIPGKISYKQFAIKVLNYGKTEEKNSKGNPEAIQERMQQSNFTLGNPEQDEDPRKKNLSGKNLRDELQLNQDDDYDDFGLESAYNLGDDSHQVEEKHQKNLLEEKKKSGVIQKQNSRSKPAEYDAIISSDEEDASKFGDSKNSELIKSV